MRLAPAIALVLRCGRILPPGFAWWIGGLLGDAVGRWPGVEQRRCRIHLAYAFPERGRIWQASCSRRVFRHMGRMALWTLSTLHRNPARIFRSIPIEGRQHLVQTIAAARRGEGTMFVSGHLGNWELLARLIGILVPVTLLGRRLRHPDLDTCIRELRSHGDNDVVYQDDDVRSLLRVLRSGRCLATLPDQDVGRLAGCFVPWFGRLAYTPLGPAALAQLTGCAIQACYMVHRGGRWVVHVAPRWQVPKRGGDRHLLQARIMARVMAWEEGLVRRHPEQWVWFHRRWRRTPEQRPDAPVITSHVRIDPYGLRRRDAVAPQAGSPPA
ncbi:MAG: lysophospholipid acyltransferase family protein [Planctomycetota bacterium]